MTFKKYVYIVLGISAWLIFEYLSLNHLISKPGLLKLLLIGLKYPIDPSAGKPLSYFLGWLGFGIMCLTNFYIIRKRFGLWSKFGTSPGWLNFHIFCGLLGPVLIIFHTNFKIGGLVAISFWSMMISAGSGIIGKYFYAQIYEQGSDFKNLMRTYEKGFTQYVTKTTRSITVDEFSQWLQSIKLIACGAKSSTEVNMAKLLFVSIFSDVRLKIAYYTKFQKLPSPIRKKLVEYGTIYRKTIFLKHFNQIMGYWHAFHLPFAIFMYVVAIIHIIVVNLFRV